MSNHTPLPWVAAKREQDWHISQEGAITAHTTVHGWKPSEDEANARLIVKAVNNHENLLAALRLVARQHEGRVVGMGQRRCDCDVCAVVRAAIAKAEGEQP